MKAKSEKRNLNNNIIEGDIITLPRNYTFGRRKFIVVKVFKDGDLKLEFLGGKEKGEPIERYGQKEVKKLERDY